jgi:hypothetical protein
LRVIPQFFVDAVEQDHTLFAAYAEDETGAEYISHELYYDESESKFIFYIRDLAGNVGRVESDVYGTANIVRQLTDLRAKHNIVCNWNADTNYMDLRIDSDVYCNTTVSLGLFPSSRTTTVGNRKTRGNAADCIFDLIRFGEEPFGCRQIEQFNHKRDPFLHQNKTDIGEVNVKALSFFGLTSSDQFERTIYTEPVDSSYRLVIDKGNEFASEVTIRHDGDDIITFGTTGVNIDGSLNVGTLVATTTATVNTTDDHLTLRFGFSGSPPATNDGYFEIERGNKPNSEIRWDESHKAWTFGDGSFSRISVDGTSIGTWAGNSHFNIVSNGTGEIRFATNTSTDGGTGDGTIARTTGPQRLAIKSNEMVVNDPRNDYDFRVESNSKAYMLFSDASTDTIIIGSSTGATPATAKSDRNASLLINTAASIYYLNDNNYGAISFHSFSGDEAGLVGLGNPGATPSYWELRTVDADELRVSGGDMVFDDATAGISFISDRTNSRVSYTADATAQTTGTSSAGIYCYGSFTAYKIYNSVWNDYAEAFEFDKENAGELKAGLVYKMTESGIIPTEGRADKATVGVYSDTYGQLMGSAGIYDEDHPDGNKLPIGLMGKVKVWVKEKLEIGDPLVSDVEGFATKATKEERVNCPDLIIGKVLETSKDNKEKRIWMLIK